MKILAVLFSLFIASCQGTGQPRIVIVEGKTFSLGTIQRGSVTDHLLTIKNPGIDTLIVSHVNVSCGCTGTLLSSDHIPPGGSGSLKITFNSKNFSGHVDKSLTILSNAAKDSILVIHFDAQVVQQLTHDPEYLLFDRAVVGNREIRKVKIANEGVYPVVFLRFSTEVPGLAIVLPADTLKQGSSIEIPVEFTPQKASEVLDGKLDIETDNPLQRHVLINIYGSIHSPQ